MLFYITSLSKHSLTFSHMFKAKSSSSKRTHFCATMLDDDELNGIYLNIKKINILLASCKKDLANLNQCHGLLRKKFKFVQESPNFYFMSLNWSGSYVEDIISLEVIHSEKTILIIERANISDETEFLKSQLSPNHTLICTLSSPDIIINDTSEGGYSYLGPK